MDKDFEKIPAEVKMPMPMPKVESSLKRPPFDTPLITLTPKIAPSLKQKMNGCPTNSTVHCQVSNSNECVFVIFLFRTYVACIIPNASFTVFMYPF